VNVADANGVRLYSEFGAKMQALGIAFRDFVRIEEVLDAFPNNPRGFHFTCQRLNLLHAALTRSQFFGREHWLFERIEKITTPDCAFRQVSNTASLHVILRFRGRSEIHLDSISIVRARDTRTGQAIYVDDVAVMIEHHRVDKNHQPCLFYCK
jgi:hypothetical protein